MLCVSCRLPVHVLLQAWGLVDLGDMRMDMVVFKVGPMTASCLCMAASSLLICCGYAEACCGACGLLQVLGMLDLGEIMMDMGLSKVGLRNASCVCMAACSLT